jgi:4-hydroxyphenylpyruvate dioxygenase
VRTGIATVSVSGLLADKLEAIAAAGFDGVEIFDPDLVASPMSPREIARRCTDLGLSIDLLQPVRDAEGVRPEELDSVLHRVRRKLDLAAELGAPTVLLCSNVSPEAMADVDLAAEQLHVIGGLAQERGVRVAYEALAWGRHVHRVGQAWERVARADHPAVGLAVDTFHVLARGDGPVALDPVPPEKLFVLQVADAPHLDMGLLQWSRHHRSFPGQGTLDVVPLVARVLEKGFAGPVSLEVFSDVVREADPFETATDGYRSLLFLADELARRDRLPRSGEGEGPVPAPPERTDAAFVELAGEAEPLLDSLGFVRAGEHRSKPVTWWRNGDAHVVLNRGEAGCRPVAVGLVAEPVTDIEARAAGLHWPGVAKSRSRGEARLPGLTSPTGVHVFVSSSPHGTDFWQHDFEPCEATGDTGSTWTGLDHVGTVVDEQHLNAETSFYRTVLGLAPGPVAEFMEPQGRMRSRVLRPRDGDLRVVINVDTGHVPVGINQLAFSCGDVRAEVRRLRGRGVEPLQPPANYYVDLEARFALEPDTLADLREHGLFYDRVGDGELLHAYTPVTVGRFYVELLERRGGYDGYGAANTAVRLALQASRTAESRAATSPS